MADCSSVIGRSPAPKNSNGSSSHRHSGIGRVRRHHDETPEPAGSARISRDHGLTELRNGVDRREIREPHVKAFSP